MAHIMNSLLLLIQQLAKGFLILETFKMYYKMGFSKIQHQLWHGKTAGVSTGEGVSQDTLPDEGVEDNGHEPGQEAGRTKPAAAS